MWRLKQKIIKNIKNYSIYKEVFYLHKNTNFYTQCGFYAMDFSNANQKVEQLEEFLLIFSINKYFCQIFIAIVLVLFKTFLVFYL